MTVEGGLNVQHHGQRRALPLLLGVLGPQAPLVQCTAPCRPQQSLTHNDIFFSVDGFVSMFNWSLASF